MLEQLSRHPGIVVLHDAFLSGLFGYLDFNVGESGRSCGRCFARTARTRAGASRRCRPLRIRLGARWSHCPPRKSVIDRAVGIVSHSPFNRERRGGALSGRLGRTVSHRETDDSRPSCDRRGESRRSAGGARAGRRRISSYARLAMSSGRSAATCCWKPFRSSPFGQNPRARLLYVGELAEDDFGHSLKKAIGASGIADRVSVTGYVDEARYAAISFDR